MKRLAVLALAVVALGAGACTEDKKGSTSTTILPTATTVAMTTTTLTREQIQAGLLQPGDVPGSTPANTPPSALDLRSCFSGHELAVQNHPTEVDSPDYNTVSPEGRFSSSTRQGSAGEARDFVTRWGTNDAAQCVLQVFRSGLTDIDASRLTATARTEAVGDAGSAIKFTGPLTLRNRTRPIEGELVLFHRSGLVVLVGGLVFDGDLPDNQIVDLAKKINGRLG